MISPLPMAGAQEPTAPTGFGRVLFFGAVIAAAIWAYQREAEEREQQRKRRSVPS